MPRDRQAQLVRALEEIAAVQNLGEHPQIKALSGEFAGWFRLRTGFTDPSSSPVRRTLTRFSTSIVLDLAAMLIDIKLQPPERTRLSSTRRSRAAWTWWCWGRKSCWRDDFEKLPADFRLTLKSQ
jgi:hypothetical protein